MLIFLFQVENAKCRCINILNKPLLTNVTISKRTIFIGRAIFKNEMSMCAFGEHFWVCSFGLLQKNKRDVVNERGEKI